MRRKFLSVMTLALSIPLVGGLQAAGVASPESTSVQLPSVNAQQGKTITVKGVVTDEQGEALLGVNVRVQGTSRVATTGIEGEFTLANISPNAVLEITSIGFATQTISVSGRTMIKIVMKEDVKSLETLVVTALGIKRSQKALSYNVQEIKSDALTTVKDANFMNALSGKVAGVNINASSSGIGGATRVVMRGPKSMNQSNQALYVIDGVPIFNVNGGQTAGVFSEQPRGEGISDINPDDIESMSVLSGPAAAALYGASAAQGVIMITTKKGKEGKVSVMLSNSSSFSRPFIMPRFQTEYINTPGSVKSWGAKQPSRYGVYDPADFFNTGTNIQNTASLTIGNAKNQTYVSVGSSNAKGIIPNSAYDRYNFTVRNTTQFLEDKMTLDVNFNFIKQDDQNLMAQGQYFNPLVPLYLFPRGENFEAIRVFEIYDPVRKIYKQNWGYGDDYKMQNPYWVAHRMVRSSDKKRYMGSASLKYQVLDWLDITGRVRADVANTFYEDKRYASTLGLFAHSPFGYYRYDKSEDRSVYADLMANINKRIDDFSISANLGISSSSTHADVHGFRGGLRGPSNFFTPNQIDYGRPTSANAPLYSEVDHLTRSAFFSGEFGYKSMLYLTLTGRSDWDSALAYTTSNPFFYPSVGLSGIITEMIKAPQWLDYLKVRASWAKVGSPIPSQISSPHRYFYDAATQSYSTVTYKFPKDFKPELTYSWEAGLTAKLFDNKVSLDVTLYQSNTLNQTFLNKITPSEGFDSEYIQAGDVRNRGIELTLGLNNKIGQVDWTTTFTYSANQNKIMDLGNDKPISKGGLSGANIYLKQGGTMGDLYIDRVVKRDREGNPVLDAQGNLLIDKLPTPIYRGSVLPDANLGLVNEFSWKGLNVGFMFSARLGGIVLSQTQAILDSYGVSQASADLRNKGGIQVNKGSISAESYYSVVGGENPLWSEYIYDATNVRLQEAHISYTLPTNLLGKARLTLGVTARNLLMIYNKAPFDPELTGSTGTYYQGFDYFMQPSLRNFGFNIKLQF